MCQRAFSFISAAFIAASLSLSANDAVTLAGGAVLRNVNVEHTGTKLVVSMDFDVTDLAPGSEGEFIYTPIIHDDNGNECLLPKVAVAGRSRYYRDLRVKTWEAPDQLFRKTSSITSIPYQAVADYEPWMEQSSLSVDEGICRCTSTQVAQVAVMPLDYRPRQFVADYLYITPEVEAVKSRELSGQAFIDFPVNLTVIYPDYRGNTTELTKIIASIDSVRLDDDVTVTSLTIKGFASPEGPYGNNIRLAKGRTEALKDYVQSLYAFAPGFIKTDYEPEDWEGLRRYLETHDIDNRDAILSIANSDLQPDPRNEKIKHDFPQQYAFLLKNVYPALRHSDYKIEYEVRGYTDPEEIARIMATRPQNLSLQEMMLLAGSLEPGSAEYNEVFETAVRMYPDSPVANLNAANNAAARGDYDRAEAYLAKAGNIPEATYTRGVIAAQQGDYDTARALLTEAAASPATSQKAADTLAQIDEITR